MGIEDVDVFVGYGAWARTEHWATAMTADGKKVLDRAPAHAQHST